LQQAKQTRDNEDGLDASMLVANNPDAMLEFVNKNYVPYIKFVALEKTTVGVRAALPDGSGLYFHKSTPNIVGTANNAYLLYFIDYKNSKDAVDGYTGADGKNSFFFDILGNDCPRGAIWSSLSRQQMLDGCATKYDSTHDLCATLIMHDGWEIKDDYPIQF
jgi:hypothetical protein